jgi:ACS family glucarate transporter-like MFS transporter
MTERAAGEVEASSSSKRLIALLMAVTSVGYLCRVAVTVVAPGMMREFGLSQTQMGTVFSAFLIGYTLFQVPSGWLADRVSCRPIFLVICGGWAVLTGLTALAAWHGFAVALAIPQLWLIRILFGVVTAPTYPTAIRTIAVAFPARLHARANGLVFASLGIGSAITPVLLAPISNRFGWRASLMVAAFLSAAAGLLWARYAPRGFHQVQIPDVAPQRLVKDGAQPLRSVSFWVLCASYILESYLGYIFVFWFYLYLVQVRHFEVLKAASVTALPWIATIFAIPLGGLASDLAVKRWGATWGRRSVPLVALCSAAIFLVIGARTAIAAIAVVALTLCTVLVLCTEGAFWATMAEMSGARSGLAGGTMNFGGNLGGMISPALTPWLAARIGWEVALTMTAVLAVVAGLLWLGVRVEAAGEQVR